MAGLRIEAGLESLLLIGWVEAAAVRCAPTGAALRSELERVCATLSRDHAGRPPSAIAELAPARELYRSFGIDPTRTRPSSEALLRRILQGKPFPEILNAVDLGNLCSILFLLPIGLYDADRLHGTVRLRRGAARESYAGIRKAEIHLEGRPVFADDEGPFGNPTSDSARTAVSRETRGLCMAILAPASFPRPTMERHLETVQDLMKRHLAPAGAAVSCRGGIHP